MVIVNNKILLLLSIFLISFLAGCGVQQTNQALPSPSASVLPVDTPSPGKKIPLIFDDDGSRDGTAALLFLLSQQDISIKAINISYHMAERTLRYTLNIWGACWLVSDIKISRWARVKTLH